jgi:DNA mismatch endonuclease (patch repair protein)
MPSRPCYALHGMGDIVDKKTRSRMMAGIRSRHTKPERLIRSLLHKAGYRFRLHSRKVPGRPDLILPKYKIAVHVHGCFWHGHDCPLYRPPETRRDFWQQKITQNRRRDRDVIEKTLQIGWRHLTIWECAIRGSKQLGTERTIARICRWIEGTRCTGDVRSRH